MNADYIVGLGTVGQTARSQVNNLLPLADNAFGEQMAGAQLQIVSRRAHHHGEGSAVHADFERLFDGDQIVAMLVGLSLLQVDDPELSRERFQSRLHATTAGSPRAIFTIAL